MSHSTSEPLTFLPRQLYFNIKVRDLLWNSGIQIDRYVLEEKFCPWIWYAFSFGQYMARLRSLRYSPKFWREKKSITVANSFITSPYNLLCWFNSNTSLWFHPIYFCLVYCNCYSPTLNISTSILRSSGLGTAPFFPPVLRFFFHIQNMNCIILEHFAILITDQQ